MKNIAEIVEEKTKEYASKKADLDVNNLPSRDYQPPLSVEEFKADLEKRTIFNVPPRFISAELKDEELGKKVDDLYRVKKGIYFFGGAGTGKTYLLYALYRRFKAERLKADFWNIPEKLSEFRSNFQDNKEGENAIEEEIKNKAVLFLDDLGSEKLTEWNMEIMYRLINYRYEQMLPTFFASNLSIKNLSEQNGDRIASRIIEMCEIIKLDGKDRRLNEIK